MPATADYTTPDYTAHGGHGLLVLGVPERTIVVSAFTLNGTLKLPQPRRPSLRPAAMGKHVRSVSHARSKTVPFSVNNLCQIIRAIHKAGTGSRA